MNSEKEQIATLGRGEMNTISLLRQASLGKGRGFEGKKVLDAGFTTKEVDLTVYAYTTDSNRSGRGGERWQSIRSVGKM